MPGREWYNFMNKLNEYFTTSTMTEPLTREDVPNDEWFQVYAKINAKVKGTGTDPITREDVPGGLWFPFLSIINKRMFDVASPENVFAGAALNFAYDEVTYNEYVPADYRKFYSFKDSEPSMPWLILTFDKKEDAPYTVSFKKDGADVTFNEKVAVLGELSGDKKTLTVKNGGNKSLMFEVIQELGVESGENVTFEATLTFDEESTTVEGTIAKIEKPTDGEQD